MVRKKQIDWEAIEREYRLGQKSMRALAFQFGINVSSVSRRVKKEGWMQDKAITVHQRTVEFIEHQECSTPIDRGVEIAAETNRQVINGHRVSLHQTLSLVRLLLLELSEAICHRDQIESDIIDYTSGENKVDRKRRNRMLNAVSLLSHVRVLRDLSVSLAKLIPLERQAYNLDRLSGDNNAPDSITITIYKNLNRDENTVK